MYNRPLLNQDALPMEHVFARDGFEIYPSFIDDEIISTIENTVSKLADKYESTSEYSFVPVVLHLLKGESAST